MGILGLTDQLVHQRISREDYTKWRRGIEVDLQRQAGTTVPLQVWNRKCGGAYGLEVNLSRYRGTTTAQPS